MTKNDAQEQAINTIDGQIIVIACPGSGKTTTLVRRINHMVNDLNIPSEEILMLTFTNAAAKEMKERYHKQYGKDNATFCTIHSLCLALLKKFLNFRTENIIKDSYSFFIEQLKNNTSIADKNDFITNILTDFSIIRNNLLDEKQYDPKSCKDKKLFLDLYYSYEAYKKENKLIDFDDMLVMAYDLLKSNANVLNWLRNKYKYIQVDEYQDVNIIQRNLIYLIAGKDGNLAVVGDDDQSIYAFRGAKPDIMLNFKKDYPNAKVIKMSTNYRSGKNIIAESDKIIKQNKNRYEKDFIAYHKTLGSVQKIYSETQIRENLWIQEKIKSLKVPLTDVAILFRTNKQAESIAASLIESNIPFHTTERIPNVYENWMFYDILSYYRLANNISYASDLRRVLNHPNRYLDNTYTRNGLNKQKMLNATLLVKESWKQEKNRTEILDFFFLLNKLKGKSPKEFLSILFKTGKYSKYINEYAKLRNIDKEDFRAQWKRYEADASKFKTWDEWNKYISQYALNLKNKEKCKTGVTLSTLHCSKGLEWDTVFIIDCVEKIYPFSRARTKEELEEERRLFYVGMTRAKKSLYLCSYKFKNGEPINPSIYIK